MVLALALCLDSIPCRLGMGAKQSGPELGVISQAWFRNIIMLMSVSCEIYAISFQKSEKQCFYYSFKSQSGLLHTQCAILPHVAAMVLHSLRFHSNTVME